MSIVRLSRPYRPHILPGMDTAHLLSAFGLVIGTVDYTLLVRRRARLRRQLREAEATQEIGLQGSSASSWSIARRSPPADPATAG
jgi:hypothetical protein